MKLQEFKRRSYRWSNQLTKAKEDVETVAKAHGLTLEQTQFHIPYFLAPDDPKQQEGEAARRAKIEALPPDVRAARVRADEVEEQFFASMKDWLRALVNRGKSAKGVAEAMDLTLEETRFLYAAIDFEDHFATR